MYNYHEGSCRKRDITTILHLTQHKLTVVIHKSADAPTAHSMSPPTTYSKRAWSRTILQYKMVAMITF